MANKTVATALALVAGAAVVVTAPGTAQADPPGGKDVTAVMFEWNFASVAKACTDDLGPAGYGYVQVSPPNERVPGPQWWTAYQPVSYRIATKLGGRDAFKSMIDTCHAAGVKVVVDTVINHMANSAGTGTGGSSYSKYDYPGLYSKSDMDDCMKDIDNYGNSWNVHHCELSGLPDLDTGEEYVRKTIAGYLNDLLSLGVDGFRIDAAKHIPPADLADIKGRLRDPGVYWKQETIGAYGEAVQPAQYTGTGDVQEFSYGRDLKRVFSGEKLAYLKNLGEAWGYVAGDKAATFVTNHDTERHNATLTYKDGAKYTLAHVFMLAWPYGSPDVHSGYQFSDDAGSPNNGRVDACYTDGWKCQHAWREIAGMVGFRNTAGSAEVTDWWDNGSNAIAFGRGSKAYVAINHESGSLTRTFQTSLPAGTYCDVQSGKPVTVNGSGQFTATLGPDTALALHTGATSCTDPGGGNPGENPGEDPGASFAVQAPTTWGENIYVTGNRSALGDWNPAGALKLDPAAYPVWKLDVALPAGTSFEYKFLRKDASGKVTWESGPNRTATVPSSGRTLLSDTWRG
ncbi:carbohydrate-binding module family 20 domain-containing protein [Streptomyces glaucescens]|uniref:Alpha-amylase n=1 Tax=Streptomyces glaucescens TaxID=1907 RepID=B0B0V6_STRGA|nr:carbohydrate-binding module family 20 domain-containing protein [Streptomyces glaucescens]AIR96216.1 putative alpha-amylase [Streptomyces glaucescens]CAL64868.1 alpha-amylase GacE2 [Streptomyces glaucescens]